MACNVCETAFQGKQSVVVTILKSGSNAHIRVTNQGRNIVRLSRIQVCRLKGNLASFLFLRPPPHTITWELNGDSIEPDQTVLMFILKDVDAGTTIQAQAEYTEIIGRSLSCPTTI